jgi:hypothetical protein
MDKFKQNTIKDYTAWDLNCPYICRMRKTRNKLRNIFKRKARRKLKVDLKEIDYEG